MDKCIKLGKQDSRMHAESFLNFEERVHSLDISNITNNLLNILNKSFTKLKIVRSV